MQFIKFVNEKTWIILFEKQSSSSFISRNNNELLQSLFLFLRWRIQNKLDRNQEIKVTNSHILNLL